MNTDAHIIEIGSKGTKYALNNEQLFQESDEVEGEFILLREKPNEIQLKRQIKTIIGKTIYKLNIKSKSDISLDFSFKGDKRKIQQLKKDVFINKIIEDFHLNDKKHFLIHPYEKYLDTLSEYQFNWIFSRRPIKPMFHYGLELSEIKEIMEFLAPIIFKHIKDYDINHLNYILYEANDD